ncbi:MULTISPECIES: ATP-dependent DNA helicase [unclassified Francisella]|uniref:ATP-dependent DNA helicase n=1 Tax=unclassified Francisella TaxID=2610885 RepID=UPI002E364309|nr:MULTISPECIES: AAA family ATPase [unclassified Francisella]MED7818816.1 AAA family ATPase [Francisella sp. 19S2-4]MED7829653.1 AAA family ATPase [Francisella sp. 19S2-10]
MQKNFFSTDQILYLSNGQKIILNDQQIKAIIKIKKFLKSKDNYFLLSGFAGTGKTTVVKKILDEYPKKAIVSAPTRKANAVISQATVSHGYTIHSLLGLQPDINLENFNPNDPVFGQIKKASIGYYDFVVIDEASMINQDLFDLISSELGNSTKVLFLGDEAQIPPVGDRSSPVFTLENRYNLTILMRQSENNPLVELSQHLRDAGESLPEFLVRRETQLNKSNEGIIFKSSNDSFREELREVFSSSFAKADPNYAKLIAWRNKTVMQSNLIIRELVFGDKAKQLEKGDILTGYRAVKAKQKDAFLINNGVDYKIVDVSERQKNINGLYGYNVKILEKSKLFRGFDEKFMFIIDVQDSDNLYNYAEIHDALLSQARGDKKWSSYNTFRRDNVLMKDIERYKDGSLRDKSWWIRKDLDYGFAITVHKSQGSTYKKVFVLLKDILLNKNIEERNQILYVAMTRPQKLCVML